MERNNISESLSNLIGLSPKQCDHVLKIISAELVHKISEDALDSEDTKLTEFDIDIPYIGIMHIEYISETRKFKVTDFKLDKIFCNNLNLAITEGKSPLENMVSEKLAKTIRNRYQALL